MPTSPPRDAAPRPGWQALPQVGPFLGLIGPVLWQPQAPAGLFRFGLGLDERHLNIVGIAHGGLLATFADCALGMAIAMDRRQRGRAGGMVTANLTLDYLAPGRVGDWVEADVTLLRSGQRLAFAQAMLRVGEAPVLRASAVFAAAPATVAGGAAVDFLSTEG